MDDTKRLIIGFVLIFTVMMMFQFYTISRQKEVPASAEEKSEVIRSDTVDKKAKRGEIPVEIRKTEPDKGERALATFLTGEDMTKESEETKTEELFVETNLMKVYMNYLGGTIDSIFLKEYDVSLVPFDQKHRLLSTTIIKGQSKVSTDLILFDARIKESERGKRVEFTYVIDSLELKKSYHFLNYSYLVELECMQEFEYIHHISAFETHEKFPREERYSGVVYSVGKKSQTIYKQKLFKGADDDITGRIDWVGYKTKYFLIGSVPENYLTEFTVKKSPDNPSIFVRSGPVSRFYFGPLKYSILSSVKGGFEDAIYFGWGFIRPISKILFRFLLFLHRFIPNYGVVIIVFAFIIILVLSPISLKSFRSMSQMQQIQPKMQELRLKYKDDPQRMNKEMMELYKEHGVNPFSSCFPMLLQMPVFFALYSVLNSIIELRGSPFILWIQDLSQRDPYYVLPILMGVSMFLQQRFLSGQSQGVSDQQKILSFMMPAVITFVFLSFPAGLALYWLTYNILMIFVQWYIRKRS